jgi:hypothetical protein
MEPGQVLVSRLTGNLKIRFSDCRVSDLRLKNYLLVTSTPVRLIDGPAPDGSVDSLRYRLREESNLDRICHR